MTDTANLHQFGTDSNAGEHTCMQCGQRAIALPDNDHGDGATVAWWDVNGYALEPCPSPATITGLHRVDHGPSVLHPGTHRYGVQLPNGRWAWAFADPVTERVKLWGGQGLQPGWAS